MVVETHWPDRFSQPHGPQDVGQILPGRFHPESFFVDVLALDKSGSMEEESFEIGKKKKELVHEAVVHFLDRKFAYRSTDMVAEISFDQETRVCCNPVNICTGYDALVQGLDQALSPPHGGTDMSLALVAAQEVLKGHGFLSFHSPFFSRVLVFSDGHSSYREQAISAAQALKNSGVLVETLGLGRSPADVDEDLLKRSATTDEEGFTHYKFLGNAESLFLTFENAATGSLTWEE